MGSSSGSDKTDWTQLSGKALAAGAGALAGLPLGPVGMVGGAIAGPLLEPLAVDILHRVGQAGKRRSGEVLASAYEAADLSEEELSARISGDDRLELLAGIAIAAATRTTWEDKVRTLGRSLASGLLASDEAEVDTEQLIMSAIADMEGPHLALLDLLVAWRPPRIVGENGPLQVDVPEYSYSMRYDHIWDAGWRRWTVIEIRAHRPQLTLAFTGLTGTLQRHGLAVFESNSDVAIQRLREAFKSDVDRVEQEQRSGRRRPRPAGSLNTRPIAGVWEPTELGEQVWLRFHTAGANVSDVWLTDAPPPEPTNLPEAEGMLWQLWLPPSRRS